MMKPAFRMNVIAAGGECSLLARMERCLGVGALALLVTAGIASAQTITVTNKNVTDPSQVGFNLLNLGTGGSAGFVSSTTLTNQTSGGLPTPAGTEITNIAFADPGTDSNKSGVYAGGVSNVAASPFGSSSLLKYLVAEGNSGDAGTVTISYSANQRALQILWGTVGTGDTLQAYNVPSGGTPSSANLVATFTGTQIQNAVSGGYTANNNLAVRITGIAPFNTLVATDNNNNPAFEFLVGQPAPEPGSVAVLSTGVLALGALRRRRKVAG